VIGNSGKIPWQIPSELAHFKSTTMGFPIIMGRETYLSLGKSLSGRINIVLTKKKDFLLEEKEVIILSSFEDAFNYCEQLNISQVFIIGGAEIFDSIIDNVDELIISHLDITVEGDRYFPQINHEIWNEEQVTQKEGFKVVTYSRKKK
jgi:dihydrofolate reductase